MKEFIQKFLTQQSINQQELNEFIVEYCKLCQVEEPSSNEINIISQLIQSGQFDLKAACKRTAIKLNIEIMDIYDKNGRLIKTIVNE